MTGNLETALLSLVVPVFNEDDGVQSCYEILKAELEKTGMRYELLFCDNGSHDQTEMILQSIAAENAAVKYVRLSRNFGYQNNITLGMQMARGDVIAVIDSDLQDPPEMIHEFLKRWREGYSVVYGVRTKRTEEPRIRILLTMLSMKFISWMADYPLPEHSSDFRLITREVRDAFLKMEESCRYVRGMVHWVGFKQIGIPYTRRGRQFNKKGRQWGEGVCALFSFMLDAVFSFSMKPLRIFSLIGLFSLFVCICMFVGYFLLRFLDSDIPPGFTTQTLLLVLNLGVTSLGIGILGEYLGRTYIETKKRPLWVVEYTLNFDTE